MIIPLKVFNISSSRAMERPSEEENPHLSRDHAHDGEKPCSTRNHAHDGEKIECDRQSKVIRLWCTNRDPSPRSPWANDALFEKDHTIINSMYEQKSTQAQWVEGP